MIIESLMTFLSKIFLFTSYVENNKGSFPHPLNSEDERKYIMLAKEGDTSAREILIKHNLRLVAHVTKKFSNAAEADDLISVGSIGLIKAINSYELKHGTQLATYAARCIENEILMYIRANKKHKPTKSLHEPIGTDREGNDIELMDLLSTKEDSVINTVETTILTEQMLELIKVLLDPREYQVIVLRYGLYNQQPMPQREVASSLGISRSYISRIEKKAVEKIREEFVKADMNID